MPFTARCLSCGFVIMANKRKTLNLLMEDHDGKSHKRSDGTWSIAVLTHTEYAMLVNASKTSAFWNAVNTRLK
jgi:hypothetical protein